MRRVILMAGCALGSACDGAFEQPEQPVGPSGEVAYIQGALAEDEEPVVEDLADEAVPPERQETPPPPPRAAPVSVELDFEALVEELMRSPGFAESMDAQGLGPPTGPRVAIEMTVAAAEDGPVCSTGQPGSEVSERPVITGEVVPAGRDRSSVPLMARLEALPAHETDPEADSFDGPERPVPFRY